MPQPDRRPRRHWLHFRILVTGKRNFTWIHVILRYFTKFSFFSLTKCQMLLDRQNSPYSQLLATTTLTKLISRTAQVLSLQQRIDIRKWFHEIFVFFTIFLIFVSIYRQLCLELFIQPTKIGPICHTRTGHTFCQNYKFGLVRFKRWRFCLQKCYW